MYIFCVITLLEFCISKLEPEPLSSSLIVAALPESISNPPPTAIAGVPLPIFTLVPLNDKFASPFKFVPLPPVITLLSALFAIVT